MLDVPAAEAADLVGALLAKYADDDEPEAAVAPAAETAAMPKPRATRKPKPE